MRKRLQRLRNILKDKRGSTYIEMAVGIILFSLTATFIVEFVPVLILKNELNNYAANVSRILSVEGIYDSSVQEVIEDYRKASELGEVTVSLDGTEFISGTEKIQLNDRIVVKVSTEYDIGIFNFGSFPVTLTNTAKARSEVYWK